MNTGGPGSQTDRSEDVPNERAAKGWSSGLTIFVIAFLLIESLTGAWIYLGSFSVFAQLQVLLHTLAGLVLFGPCVYYLVRHFLKWYRQPWTAEMVLGYALSGAVVLCLISGGVVTWQGLFARELSFGWDFVHLVTGLLVPGLVVFHLLFAVWRRRHAIVRSSGFRSAVQRFILAGAVLVTGVAGAGFLWPDRSLTAPVPDDYELPGFAQKYREYRGSPFSPSYARTRSGELIKPEALAYSESCGASGCHEQITKEWQPSAHRFSAMNPSFQAVQKIFAEDRGGASTRYCAGCHDPISLFAGAKDPHEKDLSAPGMKEGISCAVCHSISKVDRRGNADYEISAPEKYLWETEDGWKRDVSHFLIRTYSRQHLDDYRRSLLRKPAFCGTCHKQFIPEAANRFGKVTAQNQYDNWRKSRWNHEDPEKRLGCQDCHMRLVKHSTDPGRGEIGPVRRHADDGAHRHHGTIATNLFMPELLKLPHWKRHVRQTRSWLKGNTEIPEIDHLWPGGPAASVQVVSVPEQARKGKRISFRVVVKNRKAGHNFITGPLDFIRAWVHARVTGADGETMAEWGSVDEKTGRILDRPGRPHEIGNARDSGTLVLEGMPLDRTGHLLRRHELWEKAGGKGKRVIYPRRSDSQKYRFTIPADANFPLTVSASLNFRRYRQEFLDLVLPGIEERKNVLQPTVTMDTDQVTIRLTDR